MDSYRIWLGNFSDAYSLYESRRCSSFNSLFDGYDIDSSCPLLYSAVSDGLRKTSFSLAEVDYLTSCFKDEETLYEFLKITGVDVDGYYRKTVTLTKCGDRLHNINIIYDQPILKNAAMEVISSMKSGSLYEEVVLELTSELVEFARKVRSFVANDMQFIAVAKICGASNKVINALLESCNSDNTRKSRNAYYASSKRIATCCQNYDNLRVLVMSVLEYTKFKVKGIDSIDKIRLKSKYLGEIRDKNIKDKELAYYFEYGGLENVLNNLSISRIYSFSVDDLRKIGFLPDFCMDVELEEYKFYDNKRNGNESNLGDGCMGSNLGYSSSIMLEQIERMKDSNGEVDYDEVFATFDIDDVQRVAPWLVQSCCGSFLESETPMFYKACVDDTSTLNYYRNEGQINLEEVFLYFSLDELFGICDNKTLKELGLCESSTSYVKKYGVLKGNNNNE